MRKNTGDTPCPEAGSSVVTSEASGSGNREGVHRACPETWGLSKHLVWAVGGSRSHTRVAQWWDHTTDCRDA